MSFRVWAANGAVLAAMGWFAAVNAGDLDAKPLLDRPAGHSATVDGNAPGGMAALEAHAADKSAPAVAALAGAYLDHQQPGLATAVLERAPAIVRERPEIAQLYARALFHRGRAKDALVVAEAASDACATSTCPGWVVATAAKQVAFLGAVVAAGVDDPLADPDATRAAYLRSVREVGLVAVR